MVDIAYYKKLNGEFHHKVGIISCPEQLETLGIDVPDAACFFRQGRVKELTIFCKNNPGFHIVTHINSFLSVNKFIEGDYIFNLANGDDDPNLELKIPPEVIDHLYAELNHFIRGHGIGL
jgi:hypothetical protein